MIKSILHLSDTHGYHHQLHDWPEADVVVHAGDVSFAGTEHEVMAFMEWFFALPYKYKIFIAGNHDACLFGANIEGLPDNCFYLCNSSVIIEGLKFYGLPMFMENVLSGDYAKHIADIATDTDVLITHQPPYGILDWSDNTHYGDSNLLHIVWKIKPKYHLFGHIHDAQGIEHMQSTTFVNGALVDGQYRVSNHPWVLNMQG